MQLPVKLTVSVTKSNQLHWRTWIEYENTCIRSVTFAVKHSPLFIPLQKASIYNKKMAFSSRVKVVRLHHYRSLCNVQPGNLYSISCGILTFVTWAFLALCLCFIIVRYGDNQLWHKNVPLNFFYCTSINTLCLLLFLRVTFKNRKVIFSRYCDHELWDKNILLNLFWLSFQYHVLCLLLFLLIMLQHLSRASGPGFWPFH